MKWAEWNANEYAINILRGERLVWHSWNKNTELIFLKGGFRKQFFKKSLKLKIQFLKNFNAIEGLGDEIEEMSKKHTLKREKIVKKR